MAKGRKYSDEEIRKMLKAFTKPPVQTCVAVVIEVFDNYSIDVKPIGGTELFEVRLKAAIDNVKEGLVEIPTVGSSVLVGIIGNDIDTAFLIKTSKVTKTVINGGNRPLVDWPKLKDELNKTRSLLNALLTVINSAPIPEPGNGLPSALQAAMSSAITGKGLGEYSNLEDEKVLH